VHILITGGAGFIGSNLTEYHLDKGDKVHVVDDLSTGSRDNLKQFDGDTNLRFDEADILTWEGLAQAAAWADRIYHLAAVVGVFRVLEDPIKTMATNIAGCERLLRAALSGEWSPEIVIASTSEVYGTGLHYAEDAVRGLSGEHEIDPTTIPPFQEDMEPMVGSSAVSRWNYSISKLADEAFGMSYASRMGMKVIVVRFFNTIGPRQTGRYGMVVPRFVSRAVANEPISVFGDGTQTRCFCDVRDTVASLDALAKNPESYGKIVNVGNEREVSILELAELVKDRAGSSSEIKFVPYEEAYTEVFQETARRRPDLTRFRELSGFEHKWTLEQTIDELIETAGKKN
jgi:UDP-glucose 4-epimerase